MGEALLVRRLHSLALIIWNSLAKNLCFPADIAESQGYDTLCEQLRGDVIENFIMAGMSHETAMGMENPSTVGGSNNTDHMATQLDPDFASVEDLEAEVDAANSPLRSARPAASTRSSQLGTASTKSVQLLPETPPRRIR